MTRRADAILRWENENVEARNFQASQRHPPSPIGGQGGLRYDPWIGRPTQQGMHESRRPDQVILSKTGKW
jgi:hypothetical protein